MLSVAKHLLFVIKNKQKQIPRADYSEVFKWRSARRSARYDIVGALFVSLPEARKPLDPCFLLLASCSLLLAPGLCGAKPAPIDYLLDLRQTGAHLVLVTMSVPDAGPSLEIQFPAWNALYQIRDFVRNVQNVKAGCDGQPRELVPVDRNTWRTAAGPCGRLVVSYAVYAAEEGPFSCVLNDEHAFLNFAQVLFYLPTARDREARVRFILPQDWKVGTLLDSSPTSGEFKAANYDTLADSPAEAGRFQEFAYYQRGAEYRVIVHSDSVEYSPQKLLTSLQRITATETELMRDTPFARYTFILHFAREGHGGMEHRNGTAISFPASDVSTRWEGLESTAAHEFFHLWNVKRIRPQDLEPVDYIRGNDTRDLWFCEGVTSTYQEITLLRAGLIKRQRFYEHVATEIERLQDRPARTFQSAEVSGLDAWMERYPEYSRPARSISYYNKGELLGFLLDLGIRHASANRCGLDDLMRRLNDDFARRGRFFTEADLRHLVSELAPPGDWAEAFFRDYVSGTRELDYATYLGYAGLELQTETERQAALGFWGVRSANGLITVESVETDSNAERAGLSRGDILLNINGERFTALPQDVVGLKPGRGIRLEVRRRSQVITLNFDVGVRTSTHYAIREVPHPSDTQSHVRRGWLNGATND
jgi:predicted metalloprotease with PDZ domain